MINFANIYLLADVLNEHAIVSIADSAGNITYVNDQFTEISGYSLSELIGKNHRLLKSGIHSPEFYQEIWDTLLGGKAWHGEVCNRKKNGSLYWVRATIKPVLDSNGLPIQYISIRTDITELKAAEAKLQKKAELQLMIAEISRDLLDTSSIDMSSAIQRALQRCGEYLNVDRAYLFLYAEYGAKMSNTHEWCGSGIEPQLHLLQNLPFADLPWWWKQMYAGSLLEVNDVAALPSEAFAEKAHFEAQQILSLMAMPLQINGKTYGFVGFDSVRARRIWPDRDIQLLIVLTNVINSTLARKRAEQAIEVHKERLRRGQLFANIGTWDWNIQTGELFWTERIAPLFGYAVGELETSYENFLSAIHPDDRQMVIDAVNACIERNVPYEIEHRVVWPDGTIRWLLERGAVVRDESGTALQMLGVVQDVDDRKKAEQALVDAREEADRANRAKSDFLSSMSHELRTPMNAILGFAQMLEYDAGLSDDQQDNVHEILKGGRHLLELINEVLDLSKIEAGHVDLSLEPIDINCIVNECKAMVEPLMATKQITMHLNIPLQAAVRADRVRFKQALLNLLSNAVKYNRDNGHIYLDVQPGANWRLRISVTDTGAGIAPESIKDIFQPFNRLGAEHSEIEGTGIGLTITRQLVELMGGAIGVDSQVGVGSTFWIELPSEVMPDINVDAEDAATATVPQTEQYHILCIDDNPANLKLITQMLNLRQHIHLTTAHTPELGIGLALTHQPDLVLLDINMPHMDGYQVLNVLKSDADLKDVPVIAVTANAMPRDIERGRAAGFNGYITKPLNLTEFLETIDGFLAGKERASND